MFTRIELQKLKDLDGEMRESFGHVNQTWADIEYLRYLFQTNFSRLADEQTGMLFSALLTLGRDLYVHLGIIEKVLQKIEKLSPEVKAICGRRRAYLKRVNHLRNHLLVHKEKPDFHRPLWSMSSTSPGHMIEQVVLTTHEGKEKEEVLRPFEDVAEMEALLVEINSSLISMKSE